MCIVWIVKIGPVRENTIDKSCEITSCGERETLKVVFWRSSKDQSRTFVKQHEAFGYIVGARMVNMGRDRHDGSFVSALSNAATTFHARKWFASSRARSVSRDLREKALRGLGRECCAWPVGRHDDKCSRGNCAISQYDGRRYAWNVRYWVRGSCELDYSSSRSQLIKLINYNW